MSDKQYERNPYSKIYGVVDHAQAEAVKSGLPGLHNGPGDAYRHIIGAGEITRRFGEPTARVALEGHEIEGVVRNRQPRSELHMDRHNNEIGIAIGRKAKTLDEVIERARERIDRAAQGAAGADVPRWLPETQWSPGGANWPPKWSAPSPGDYEQGGEDHRYPGWRDVPDDAPGPEDSLRDILGRPLESWGEADVRALMKSDTYLNSWHPGFAALQTRIMRWHERAYGRGSSGAVHVRAHTRDGGQVSVIAHDRVRPGPAR
ncbi:MAG: hypothetical protein FJX42_04890 [Alphaproteobacteria bacterium]|nr:hypothetical protein [Alphaproteobacteria bacterium]